MTINEKAIEELKFGLEVAKEMGLEDVNGPWVKYTISVLKAVSKITSEHLGVLQGYREGWMMPDKETEINELWDLLETLGDIHKKG